MEEFTPVPTIQLLMCLYQQRSCCLEAMAVNLYITLDCDVLMLDYFLIRSRVSKYVVNAFHK